MNFWMCEIDSEGVGGAIHSCATDLKDLLPECHYGYPISGDLFRVWVEAEDKAGAIRKAWLRMRAKKRKEVDLIGED